MISQNSPPHNKFPGDYMSRPSRRIGDSDSDSQDSDDHVDLLCSHRLCGHYSLFLLVYSHAKSHWPKICDDVKPRTSMMAGNILRRPLAASCGGIPEKSQPTQQPTAPFSHPTAR